MSLCLPNVHCTCTPPYPTAYKTPNPNASQDPPHPIRPTHPIDPILSDAVEDGELYREKEGEMAPKVQYCLYNLQSMGPDNLQVSFPFLNLR